MGLTLFDKVWQRNLVQPESAEHPALLYVSLHLLHEITAPQAFAWLEAEGLRVRRPDRTLALVDHCAPSEKDAAGAFIHKDPEARRQILALEAACRRHELPCLGLDHRWQGIVHAVGPELGLSRPGDVIVCGDSHSSTHGAFGAIAFGIGSSEVGQVLASQCILQRKPKNMRVVIEGELAPGVSAKDLALAFIQKIGALGGKGYAIEYQGSCVRQLTMEQRLTLCNMTIEAGARFGLIAPDAITWDYLKATPAFARFPCSPDPELVSDADAVWDASIHLDASAVRAMMTWGTNPAMAMALGESLPVARTAGEEAAQRYMGWTESPGPRPVDQVFIGSCTNGRISDLREAAQVFSGMNVAAHTRCLVVPASQQVKRQAEAEGLDQIFRQAGALWGEPGCSLCNAMNGDVVPAGKLSVSTSNRNFEGRQGPGARTVLVSPRSAAEIAIRGYL